MQERAEAREARLEQVREHNSQVRAGERAETREAERTLFLYIDMRAWPVAENLCLSIFTCDTNEKKNISFVRSFIYFLKQSNTR